jgi:hypothetical protein
MAAAVRVKSPRILDLFRTHVMNRSEIGALGRASPGELRNSDSEIRQEKTLPPVDQNVLRLNIAVNNALLMSETQGRQDVARAADSKVNRRAPNRSIRRASDSPPMNRNINASRS